MAGVIVEVATGRTVGAGRAIVITRAPALAESVEVTRYGKLATGRKPAAGRRQDVGSDGPGEGGQASADERLVEVKPEDIVSSPQISGRLRS
jgi:hypothetical protein